MEQNNKYKTPKKSNEIPQIKIQVYTNDLSTIKILKEISKFLYKYIIDILPSNIALEKKEKIEIYFNKVLALIKILSSEQKKIIEKYDSLLQLAEEKIRSLYSTLFNMKIKTTFLENNIDVLMTKEKEYRLVKEKTGILVENGVVINNDRKEHEIFILRTENSNLKKVIKEKEEELNNLNNKNKKENLLYNKKIEELKHKIEQLKYKIKLKNNKIKGHSYSHLNINNTDINDPNISKNNISYNNLYINKNNKNNINLNKRKYNSNLLNINTNKYLSLIHCQSMGHLDLDLFNNKINQIKSKSKNKTNNNINNSKNKDKNLNLNNISVSPIHQKKKLYYTPHNNNIEENKINFQPINNSKIKKDNNNNKSKIINNKNNNYLKVLHYKSKSKIINKISEKEYFQKKLNKDSALSQNISINNSLIPKSKTKMSKSKINIKRSTSKQNENDKNKNNRLLITNASGKENIPINKTCLSSIRRKNTINTSNNSFYSKIF